jgi:GntR family transcriptional regulator
MNHERQLDAVVAPPDPALPTPLYYQVASALKEQILSGRLAPGHLVPPEVQLAAQLGVSRQTMRQAIGLLVRAGLLVRRRGKGTFVALPRIEQDLTHFASFSAAMRSKGLREETRLLRWDQVPAGAATAREIAERLELAEPDAQLLRLDRLRLVEGVPFLLETIYLPPAIAGQLLRSNEPMADLATAPVYRLLQQCCGLVMTRARETIYPTALDEEEARQLAAAPGIPAFRVHRVAYAGVRPVEWRESLVRGDRAAYVVELTSAPNGQSLDTGETLNTEAALATKPGMTTAFGQWESPLQGKGG